MCEFEAPYQLSEITEDIRSKYALALASILHVDASLIVLAFVEIDLSLRSGRRLQARGVLVVVSVKLGQGSTAPAATQISQGTLDSQMSLLGLRAAKLVPDDFVPAVTQGTSPTISAGPTA